MYANGLLWSIMLMDSSMMPALCMLLYMLDIICQDLVGGHSFFYHKVYTYMYIHIYMNIIMETFLSVLKNHPDCARDTAMGCVDMLAYTTGLG